MGALFVLSVLIIILVIAAAVTEKEERLLPPPKKRFVQCQFCNSRIHSINWFRKGWTCNSCWDKYDLDGYTETKRHYRWRIAKVKIEEIECGNEL
jgi:ribosomal protein L37AE/L43A